MSNPPWTAQAASLLLRPVLWLSVLFTLFQAGVLPGFAQAATNLAIGTTVQQPDAKRLGVNIVGEDFYDSGQLMKNLLYRNPGFEGEIWRSILSCVVTTPTTCQDQDIYNAWPANFLKGATFQFIYGAANGETGTIAGNTVSNYQANAGITVTFSAPLSPAPAAGDYLIVQMNVPGNAQAGWWTSTSGGAAMATDTTDLAPDSPGKQALSISAAASGQSATVTGSFDTANGRSFLQLKGAYTLVFKAKGMGGNNQLNVSVARGGTAHGNENFLNQNVALTNQWQDYSYTFNAAEDGSYIGPVEVDFNVSGANIYLDDVALTPAATAGNPSDFRDEVVARLKALRPGVIRYMDSGGNLGSTIDNMLAVPFARQRSGFNESQTEYDAIDFGLPEFLALCQTVGAEPWYTVPASVSPTEMQNLIQYLAGDASTPYGAIRAAQGQTQPWTSVFPVIHLELGNEMWNGGAFWGQIMLNPVAYGNRAATIFAAARATPGYDAGKFDLVLGSQSVNSWLTQQEMNNSSGYDSVDAAPYLFNSLNDDSSNEAIYGPMFAEPEMVDSNASGYMAQQAQAASSQKVPAKVEVYEVNLSTTTGTAPQNTVTAVVGSVGAGIALADHMLLMMRDDGITTQNMFALPGYTNGYADTATGSGGTMPLWGSVIDMGGETNVSRPTYLAAQLANSAILPTMLAVTTTGANPTWNQPLSSNGSIQLNNAHYLQSFAFTDGTHSSVVVFNLSRSGSLPVTFSGPNAPSGDVLVSQLTSTNITDNNENLTSDTPVVNTTRTNVANFNPATPYSLPPFSMTVFLWPGSTLPQSTTTLTATPTSGAVGQSIALTAAVTSQSGTNAPTGTVSFLDGATTLGTASLDANGAAAFSTTALPAGTDSITASYGGDSIDAGSVSSPVTVNVGVATGPEYTMAVSSSDVVVTKGQVANLTVTLTPLNGFNMPVNLTCSGLPAGMSCSFSPPTVTPNGAPVSSTLSILAAPPTGSSATAQNRMPFHSTPGRLAFGFAMPWGIFSLAGLSTRKNRSRLAAWPLRLAVAALLIAGSLWISGCGYSQNASSFTMTLTSSGSNVPTHTSLITVNVAK